MFHIIETEEQVDKFILKGYKNVFIYLIPFSDNYHSAINKLSLLYIKPYNEKGYIISHEHNESLPLNITHIIKLLRTIDTIYTINKKECFYYLGEEFNVKLKDINFLEKIDLNVESKIKQFYYTKYDFNYINTIIPLSKHYEYCEEIYENIKHLLNKEIDNLYNNSGSLVFYNIEQKGIKINHETFRKHFSITEKYSIKNNIIYTNYNLYTTTRRPSNSFNGINFLALNKSNKCKTSFIPKNDIFIELDLSSYHPTLISSLINYDFNGENIHEHFSKLYNTTYEEAKEITFQQIYGHVFPQYKNLDFFKRIENLKTQYYNSFIKENKFITDNKTVFSGDNMNSSKLFNYIIQEKETFTNIILLDKILNLLKNKKSELILYVYDSFILDIDYKEYSIIDEIKEIFNTNKFTFKINEKHTLD